jgi:hypothetical protein
MSIEGQKRIEDLAPKRQSPVTYNDMKGDIFNLCSNRWPLINSDNIIDSFRSELNYQMNSFVDNADRLKFLEYLLEDLVSHHSIYETNYAPYPILTSSSMDNHFIGSSIKPIIVREYIREWKDKVVRPPKKRKPKPEPKTLKEIWEGNDESYNKLIKELQKHQANIGTSFVTETNGKLVWNKQPLKGFVQYIAGMFHILMKNKWINNRYSAPQLVGTVYVTFNIIISENPLKSVGTKPPNEIYTAPFESLANKLK